MPVEFCLYIYIKPRKKLNTKACGKIVKKGERTQMPVLNETETAALFRQANKWNQLAKLKGWFKWRRKIKEKEGWNKIYYFHLIKNCTWQPISWQRAIWQRLEICNPCTQYKTHYDANNHWAIDARDVPALRYSSRLYYHSHVEKERNNPRNKRESKETKNKNGVNAKNLTDPGKAQSI